MKKYKHSGQKYPWKAVKLLMWIIDYILAYFFMGPNIRVLENKGRYRTLLVDPSPANLFLVLHKVPAQTLAHRNAQGQHRRGRKRKGAASFRLPPNPPVTPYLHCLSGCKPGCPHASHSVCFTYWSPNWEHDTLTSASLSWWCAPTRSLQAYFHSHKNDTSAAGTS